MRVERWHRWLVVALVVIHAGGCASNPAPSGWLDEPEVAARDPYGCWIEVWQGQKDHKAKVAGELIAVGESDLIVLTPADSAVIIPRLEVIKARTASFTPKLESLSAWTVLGTASTLSHGMFLVFTAPLWILGGTAATASHSRAPLTVYPAVPWSHLKRCARFPQGLPPGLDLNALRSKGPF